VPRGREPVGKKKCHQAWKTWWDANEDTIRLEDINLNRTELGYTLVAFKTKDVNGPGSGTWRLQELDANFAPRWRFEVPAPETIVDAWVIAEDRVLMADASGKITIRNFKGEVKYSRQMNNPQNVQRLANGNIFVVELRRMVEFTPEGREVWKHENRDGSLIVRGLKLRTGDVVYITSSGTLRHVNAETKRTMHSVASGFSRNPSWPHGSFDVLPNGNYLVPQYHQNKVVEFTPKGQVAWVAMVQCPMTAQRLANGNTLVACAERGRIVELDREGREIASTVYTPEGLPYVARRR
jgi:hypothetical protein